MQPELDLHRKGKPWITTYPSGLTINPFDLRPENINIEDIAHHLAIQNRWVGATSQPICTAQHSFFVMKLCEPFGPRIALQGLMHDAPEAYLGDVSKWLKATPEMKQYRDAEDRAWKVISGVFGMDEELHPEVKRADDVLASYEAEKGLAKPNYWFTLSNYSPASDLDRSILEPWWFWGWRIAESVFLKEFHRLVSEIARFSGRNSV